MSDNLFTYPELTPVIPGDELPELAARVHAALGK